MARLEEDLARVQELRRVVGGTLFHVYNLVLESPSTRGTATFDAIAAPNAHIGADSDRYGTLIIGEYIIKSPDELERIVVAHGERLRFDVPVGLPHYQRGPLPRGIVLGNAEERTVIYHRTNWTQFQRDSLLRETGKSTRRA